MVETTARSLVLLG